MPRKKTEKKPGKIIQVIISSTINKGDTGWMTILDDNGVVWEKKVEEGQCSWEEVCVD
tara:strand:+ start:323 stop:496 length:174 start_codon:yes stop_codon:yes gene_type:complete